MTGHPISTGVKHLKTFYIFSVTSKSFKEFPFLKDVISGYIKISLSRGWFCIMCQFSIKTCLILCLQPSVKIGLVKGEALRLLRTNSSKTTYDEIISNFKTRLLARGYPHNLIEKVLSEIIFTARSLALKQENRTHKDSQFVFCYNIRAFNAKDQTA